MFREILWPRVGAGSGRKSGPHVSGKGDSTASIRSLERPLTAPKRRSLILRLAALLQSQIEVIYCSLLHLQQISS